jgi:hypothetical protein
MSPRKLLIIKLAVFVLLVTGCSQSRTDTSTIESYVEMIPETELITPTYTLTKMPKTHQKVPSSTLHPPTVSIPTLTLTTTITPPTTAQTITPESTLTENQRKLLLLDLLHNNMGCKLPCWWGFQLGEAPWEIVRTSLLHMGARTGDYRLDDGSVFHGTGGFDWSFPFISNGIGFYEVNGIVNAITIQTEGYDDLDFFRELWKSYSPEQVMKEYGSPSQVFVFAFSYGEIGVTSSVLIFVYEEHGFLTWYETKALVVQGVNEPMLKICPSWSDLTWQPKLKMYIRDVNSSKTFEDLLKILTNINGIPGKPIEEAVGITPEQFYQRFQPGKGPACLETPERIWFNQ